MPDFPYIWQLSWPQQLGIYLSIVSLLITGWTFARLRRTRTAVAAANSQARKKSSVTLLDHHHQQLLDIQGLLLDSQRRINSGQAAIERVLSDWQVATAKAATRLSELQHSPQKRGRWLHRGSSSANNTLSELLSGIDSVRYGRLNHIDDLLLRIERIALRLPQCRMNIDISSRRSHDAWLHLVSEIPELNARMAGFLSSKEVRDA